jgi:hypothetical protein
MLGIMNKTKTALRSSAKPSSLKTLIWFGFIKSTILGFKLDLRTEYDDVLTVYYRRLFFVVEVFETGQEINESLINIVK